MRTSPSLFVAVSMLAALVISCSRAENKNALPTPTAAPTQIVAANVSTPASTTATPLGSNAASPFSRSRNLPPEGGDKPTNAEFNGYPYSYKTDGGKTVATFGTKLLPADRDIVASAIRDIIYRSYGDRVDAAPHIEGTGSAQTIRIDGSKHKYIVVPIKEPTGEIHSLIITQLN
jgi:guanyl-specific ribonuclease Sa